MKNEYSQLKKYMDQSQKTVVVTGSGISYLYGMSRLKQSVGRLNAGRIFSASYVRKNPEEFYKVMKDSFLDATFLKGPGPVHKQLAELEKQGKIYGIVTQNLDCLHTIAGSQNVVEFQGSFRDNICIDCGNRYFDYRVWSRGHMPRCEKCGAPLMPTAFCRDFGSTTNTLQDSMKQAADMISKADLILVIGTRGNYGDVYWNHRNKDAVIVQINPGHTGFDRIADLNIREASDEVFHQLTARR